MAGFSLQTISEWLSAYGTSGGQLITEFVLFVAQYWVWVLGIYIVMLLLLSYASQKIYVHYFAILQKYVLKIDHIQYQIISMLHAHKDTISNYKLASQEFFAAQKEIAVEKGKNYIEHIQPFHLAVSHLEQHTGHTVIPSTVRDSLQNKKTFIMRMKKLYGAITGVLAFLTLGFALLVRKPLYY